MMVPALLCSLCAIYALSACDTYALLFVLADGISENDIQQNQIGNCWLLSSFAAIARVAPHVIEQRFVSPLDPNTGRPTISQEGRYIVQLWDVPSKQWVNIIIDDW